MSFSLKVLFVLAIGTVALTTATGSSSNKVSVSLNLAAGPKSLPIRSDFASFSVEVPCMKAMMMSWPNNTVRPSYINLMRFLKSESKGHLGPNVRIGGNSADDTYFNANGDSSQRPKNDTYTASMEDVNAMSHVIEWGGTITPDLNLRNRTDPSNAVEYAKAIVDTVDPSILAAFEIGNEPELFDKPNNAIRPAPYTYDEWKADWTLYANALWPVANKPRVQGAVFCCGQWNNHLPNYTTEFTTPPNDYLRTVSHHFYPMSSKMATIPLLLAPFAVDNLKPLGQYAQQATSRGIDFVLGEGNSAYDGGKKGVSNTFASTVWGIDVLFTAATIGIRRYNFHGCPGGAYTPIDIDYGHSIAQARPLYYGMWAFTRATAWGARVVQVDKSEEQSTSNSSDLRVHAAYADSPSRLSVMLLHKNPNATTAEPFDVDLNLAGAGCEGRNATVEVGHTGSGEWSETWNITFAGLTFEGSTNGYPIEQQPRPIPQQILVGSDGKLTKTIRVDPVSFVLVTVTACNYRW